MPPAELPPTELVVVVELDEAVPPAPVVVVAPEVLASSPQAMSSSEARAMGASRY